MGIVAVIVGILGVVCSLPAAFLLGTLGGIIVGVLGVLAIVFGIIKRKKDGKGGIPGIVIGVLAIIAAVSMTFVSSSIFSELHKKAVEYRPDGLWAKVSEDTSGGMLGIIKNLPTDEASLNALIDEMNELNKITEEK